MVRLENIEKTYIMGSVRVPVLKGISLVIRQGEFVGIMGASGSGKSTMLNLLGLLDKPSAGKYFLTELEVENLPDNRLAELRNSCIGFIFQSFNLFPHLSVEENIQVPLIYMGIPRRRRHEIAKDLASKVGLGHRLKHRPTELSGGECQRIAVARALSTTPSFLLADEPTGNLDAKTSAEIMKLFHELHAKGVTIIMVTHNPEYEKVFERVVHMRDGKVLSDGPPHSEAQKE
ncbi:MAG: macrolide ABC transporter ATP-binding protein [Lentisphaerae bacterium GWF2_52_8]|nr:MAG: macrolide ABC transporter ATP-binding protein [Lentisphaerae bacterium GWF2_52_8]